MSPGRPLDLWRFPLDTLNVRPTLFCLSVCVTSEKLDTILVLVLALLWMMCLSPPASSRPFFIFPLIFYSVKMKRLTIRFFKKIFILLGIL